MKICLINNLYEPFNRGGAETITKIIAEGLQHAGHQIIIATTRPYGSRTKIPNDKIYRIRSLFFDLDRIPFFFRIFWHLYDSFDLISAAKIFFILKKENPDAVITNNLKGMSYLIPFVIRLQRIKHVHILHDIQLLHPSGLMLYQQENMLSTWPARIYQNLNKFLFSFPQAIISPSRWLLSLHVERGFFAHSKKEVINNPAIISWPADFYQKKNSLSAKNFLFVGLIEKHKGIELLLESFSGSLEELPENFRLFIVGDGTMLEHCQKIFNNKRIIFLGRPAHNEVIKTMINAYCLIVPSLCYENSPTVVYEALSVGLPILAADIGGLGELVKKTAGALFAPADGRQLRQKIIWSARNPEKLAEMSELGLQKIKFCDRSAYLENIIKMIA